jgi:Uncharacterized protein conserved in bacteria (DUF2087)
MASECVDPLRDWAAVVAKDHLRLRGLPLDGQRRALAWVWAGLPPDEVLTETGVTAALQAQLAGAACFLDTDHVELRRWLVDGGWLARDGYGRAYRRVTATALPLELRPLVVALDGLDTGAWTRDQRDRRAAERDRKRQAWAGRATGVP